MTIGSLDCQEIETEEDGFNGVSNWERGDKDCF